MRIDIDDIVEMKDGCIGKVVSIRLGSPFIYNDPSDEEWIMVDLGGYDGFPCHVHFPSKKVKRILKKSKTKLTRLSEYMKGK